VIRRAIIIGLLILNTATLYAIEKHLALIAASLALISLDAPAPAKHHSQPTLRLSCENPNQR
jgi:hypothetical protein